MENYIQVVYEPLILTAEDTFSKADIVSMIKADAAVESETVLILSDTIMAN